MLGSTAGCCPCCPFPPGSRGLLDPAVLGQDWGTPRGVGTSEFPMLGRGWGRRVPGQGRPLVPPSLGDWCCLAWVEFRARCCCPAPPALGSIPGCPAGSPPCGLAVSGGRCRARKAVRGRCPFWESEVSLHEPGARRGWLRAALFPSPGSGAAGQRARWPAGPLAGSKLALHSSA